MVRLKPIIKNKKGILGDLVTILGVIMSVAILFIVGKMIYNEVVGGFISLETEMQNDTSTNVNYTLATDTVKKFDPYWKSMDYSFLLFVVALTIALIITAFKINTHPAFLIINIVGLFLLLFLAIIYTFIWNQVFITDVFNFGVGGLSSAADTFTVTAFVMKNYPWFAFFISLIGSIVMYAKSGGQNL